MTRDKGYYISICPRCKTSFPLHMRECSVCHEALTAEWCEPRTVPRYTVAWVLITSVGLAALLVILILHNTN